MRLSQHAYQHGIDSFNADDFEFIGAKISEDPTRLILVGGQALEVWGLYLGVLAPTGDTHPLTQDADWLGSQEDAVWLCDLLGMDAIELKLADATEPGCSTGIAFMERPDGRIVLMDFLRAIVGPSVQEVERLAVPLMIGGKIQLNVLHPLLCLESRFANLAVLPSKRNGNGPMQAQWAIDIVAAYLLRLADAGASLRQLIKACHKVADCAEYKHGKFCLLTFGLDPLAAVSPELVERIGGRFAADDWPRTIARIEKRRAGWRKQEVARDAGMAAPSGQKGGA